MLKSDRLFLARFAMDPEIEFNDIDLYFDDENEEIARDRAMDSFCESHEDDFFFEDQNEVEEQ
jgi:hypothetical protein